MFTFMTPNYKLRELCYLIFFVSNFLRDNLIFKRLDYVFNFNVKFWREIEILNRLEFFKCCTLAKYSLHITL